MRFRKGTLDHDGDGKPGGSMKETDMTTKKPEAKKESAHTAKTGMEPGLSPKERRAELNKQFEEADEEGKAAIIEEAQIGLQVRGY